MRLRPIVALSAAVATVLLLAGCAAGGTDTASPSATAAGDLCAAAAPEGDASKAVTVTGDVGKTPTATFASPLTIDSVQRSVVAEGTGDQVAAGDLVNIAYAAYDASTGSLLGSVGYDSSILPIQMSTDSGLGQFLGCAKTGTRVTVTRPGDESTPAAVFVLDLLSIARNAAWGAAQTPLAGFPAVTLADNGEPTLSVPSDLATPATTQVETLKKGDGAVVGDGDTVLVQYTGALTDGTVFDSSWTNGSPAEFATNQVVAGFGKALVGQTVGSQVVAVIPPGEGYGDTAKGSIPAGSTLVFVVDILGTQPASTQ